MDHLLLSVFQSRNIGPDTLIWQFTIVLPGSVSAGTAILTPTASLRIRYKSETM